MGETVPQTNSEQAQSTSTSVETRHNGRGRGRGQHRGGTSLSFRPATVTPQTQQGMVSNAAAENTTKSKPRHRNDRRGRGGTSLQSHTVNGRQFGGQLTEDTTTDSNFVTNPTTLQASAPVFIPGQHSAQTYVSPQLQSGAKRPQRLQQRRPSKSQAPDISTRTHEDIDNGHYECAICTGEVVRKSKVWSCHTCWTVFHLSCIKKWSTNEGSAAIRQQPQNTDITPARQWRCPGCNLPKDELPKQYACWCEKEIEPRAPGGIPPHSCGSTCGKERARKCPHPCELTCHSGPCPPCSYIGPIQTCFCGRHEVTKRCSETDYDYGWSCGDVCGQLLPCGEHACERSCHSGPCGACEERVPARCYCGQVEKDIVCTERGEQAESRRTYGNEDGSPVIESWTGSFNCGNACDRTLDCGIHHCEEPCHPSTSEPEHCPRSPNIITHCCCGKTPLGDLIQAPRESCLDPIPSCDRPCDKVLSCGHVCKITCHTGPCPSCMLTVTIKCRCGRTENKTICHQGKDEPPHCTRACRTTLNCGRHACEERCCPGQTKAAERQGAKRKPRPLGSAPRIVEYGFEAEHICTRECGRLLKCGVHICHDLCHKGQCGTCREAIFEEISCHCGRTVLQPPLPCGTKPPPCRYPCTRPKACGHPQVAHACHEDDQTCPNCPYLVEKRCMCGKKTLKNQQCWLHDVSCGMPCGKKLKCGSHSCRKVCHRTNECEDAHGQPCSQPCMKEKLICEHPHTEETCHAPYPCKEDKPCQNKIYVTCACQAQKQEMKCGASRMSEGNAVRSLTCNDDCAKLERNRKLALALNIDQATHVDGGDHIPYSNETLNLYAEHVKWAQTQEREFRVFASSEAEKRLRFPPMKPPQRAFIHALAEDFGFDSESMDSEPHRHVMLWKTPRFVSAPNKTLADALRIRKAQRSATVSANVSDNEDGLKRDLRRSNEVAEPFNGFVISNPRFGLTADELEAELTHLTPYAAPYEIHIKFLLSGEVVLRAVSGFMSAQQLQQLVHDLKSPLATSIASKGYGTAELCATDAAHNILRRESDRANSDGWSRVAAKKAAPRLAVQSGGLGSSNSFAALTGTKVTFVAKKKPEKSLLREVAPDDWEAAEIAEEEKEKGDRGDVDTSLADATVVNDG